MSAPLPLRVFLISGLETWYVTTLVLLVKLYYSNNMIIFNKNSAYRQEDGSVPCQVPLGVSDLDWFNSSSRM